MAELSLEFVSKPDWDDLLKKVPNHPIFFRELASNSVRKFLRVKISNGNNLVAIAHFPNVGDDNSLICDDHHIYNGVCFSPIIFSYSRAKQTSLKLKVTKLLRDNLIGNFKKIIFRTWYNEIDIRHWLWIPYDYKGKTCLATPRYTNVIDLDKPILDGLVAKDRNIIKNIEQGDCTFIKEIYDGHFPELYKAMFSSQGISISDFEVEKLANILTRLNQENLVEIWSAYSDDNLLLNQQVISIHGEIATSLYGYSSPIQRSRNSGFCLFYTILSNLTDRGLKKFDFEGVNSPARGSFKERFSGKTMLYFQVEIN